MSTKVALPLPPLPNEAILTRSFPAWAVQLSSVAPHHFNNLG